jgi:hypothetical protein
MMRCQTCFQDFTVCDFVSLRNLCEHVYLDSLAKKQHPVFSDPARSFHQFTLSQSVGPAEVESPRASG